MSEGSAASGAETGSFVQTLEFRRFAEFCEACCRHRYIGLCYGPPGVGKTLSARRYANWDKVSAISWLGKTPLADIVALGKPQTVLYTAPVVNTPNMVERDISALRRSLHDLRLEPLRREEDVAFEQVRQQEAAREKVRQERLLLHDWLSGTPQEPPRTGPTFAHTAQEYEQKRRQIPDPTTLILVDEADRLKMASLEATRALFDRGDIGLVLIGMPGMEKRLARYPQFYSRIGFVHEFRPLGVAEVRHLLKEGWLPPGVCLPPLDDEAIAAIIRITSGNFRLLDRLLSQTERIVQINQLPGVTKKAVEAARESLVIGQ